MTNRSSVSTASGHTWSNQQGSTARTSYLCFALVLLVSVRRGRCTCFVCASINQTVPLGPHELELQSGLHLGHSRDPPSNGFEFLGPRLGLKTWDFQNSFVLWFEVAIGQTLVRTFPSHLLARVPLIFLRHVSLLSPYFQAPKVAFFSKQPMTF